MFTGQIEFKPASSSLAFTCCIGQRLQLRPLELSDTQALFALTESNRAYLRKWLPWLDFNQRVEDTRHFIRTRIEKAQVHQELVSAICYDHQIVGLIGLHDINWLNRSAGIGYWLAESYQGQGIMTLACRATIDYGFSTLTLNRLDILCASENSRSEAVAKRIGLTYEGTLREAEWLYDRFVNHKIYAMLRSDWQA